MLIITRLPTRLTFGRFFNHDIEISSETMIMLSGLRVGIFVYHLGKKRLRSVSKPKIENKFDIFSEYEI